MPTPLKIWFSKLKWWGLLWLILGYPLELLRDWGFSKLTDYFRQNPGPVKMSLEFILKTPLLLPGLIVASALSYVFVDAWREVKREKKKPKGVSLKIPRIEVEQSKSDYVTVGVHEHGYLRSAIRAKAIRGERGQPDIEVFLERVSYGVPYCSDCARKLYPARASRMADGVQYGYRCNSCHADEGEEIERTPQDLLIDIKAKVRIDYDSFWKTYKEEVRKHFSSGLEDYKFPY